MILGRFFLSYPQCAPLLAFGVLLINTPAAAGCNSGNVGQTSMLTSVDCQGSAGGSGALAVGQYSSAPSILSTAIGHQSLAQGSGATAVGGDSTAKGVGSTALGQQSGQAATADGFTALGAGSGYQAGAYSTSVGLSAWSPGAFSIGIGGGDSVVNSPGARANGYRSISIGQMSSTGNTGTINGFGLEDFGTSVGFNTHTAFAATAVGTDAQAKGDSSAALGRFSNAAASSSVALGKSATATQARSVALGSASVANVADTVSVGTLSYRRRIVNVAQGINGTDVPNLAQVKALISAATKGPATAWLPATSTFNEVSGNEISRELVELRAVVRVLQRRLEELESRSSVEQTVKAERR